jgi:DNA invertase Pin-like site-specific DNA recombinase
VLRSNEGERIVVVGRVVNRLDRLARSTKDLLRIVERLDRNGVALRIVDFAVSGPR